MSPIVPALAATLAAQLLASMAGAIGPVIAPVAAADLGVPVSLIGAYVSLVWIGASLGGLTAGGFVARFGPLRVSQAGLVLSAVGLALSALGNLPAVLAGALLIGLALGPMTPASSFILARLASPAWLNFVFSAKQTGVPLGLGLAGLMMPPLTLLYGWHAAVLVAAVLCAVLALMLQPLRAGYDSERDPARPLLSFAHFVSPIRYILNSPPLRRTAVMSFTYAGMQNCYSSFLVAYLNERLGMSLVVAGFVFTVGHTAGAVGRLVWAAAADRYIRPVPLLGGLGIAMTGCSLLTAAFTDAWPMWSILAVSIAFGATSVAWNGVYLAQVATIAPRERVSEATGASGFVTFIGIVTIPALFTVVLTLSDSYAAGFIVVAVLTLSTGLWLLATARQHGKP